MAMSSLTPGVLFKRSGLNQHHTPTNITANSDQVKTKYRRSSIPDRKWPPESPVAQVYDIRNSSSRLIILNNRMEKKSHLRVQSGRYKSSSESGEDKKKAVEPDRHFTGGYTRSSRHDECYNSSSPKFEPTPSRPTTSHSPRAKSAGRYPATSGSAVPSEWHHYSSQVDRPRQMYSAPPKRSKSAGRRALEPPPCFRQDKRWLLHPDMSYGQKKYMNHIARTYDITDMKQLKQAQYVQLIAREQQRALYFFTPEEYKKYLAYLNSPRMRQFKSAPPPTTHYKQSDAKGKMLRKESKKAEENNTKESGEQNGESKKATELETSARQSPTPKSYPRRSHTPTPGSATADRKGSNLTDTGSDDTEYMAYSEAENAKQEKTTPRVRPKSSKFRDRGSAEERTHQMSSSSSEEEKRFEKEESYWEQPAPPVKETEPDGSGLVMTEDGKLDKDGEAIERLAIENKVEERRTSAKKERADSPVEHTKNTTYDIEHRDGTKTRVYAPPIVKKGRERDVPVVKEAEEPATQTKQSVEKEELREAMERRWEAVESDRESRRARHPDSLIEE